LTHLSAADVALVRRRTGPATQLGFAVQLAAIRAIGTMVPDVTQVPIRSAGRWRDKPMAGVGL
jgi:hypothetical protein